MELESKRYLSDVLFAADLLNNFTTGKAFADYTSDPILRSATERQFGIIGEAISKLARVDEATASRISEYQRIISFRNILIHRYDTVNDRIVWSALQSRLPVLVSEIEVLLAEEPTPPEKPPTL